MKHVLEDLLVRLDWKDEIDPIDERHIWRVRTTYVANNFAFDCFLEVDEEMGWFHVFFYSPLAPCDREGEFVGLANEVNGRLPFGRFHIGRRIQFKHGLDLEGAADPSLAAFNVFCAGSAALDRWHGDFARLAVGDPGPEPEGDPSSAAPIAEGTRH